MRSGQGSREASPARGAPGTSAPVSTALRTARLRLDPFHPGDAPALLRMFRDREVRRYLLDDVLVSPAWVRAEIRSSRARFDSGGAGLWSARSTDGEDLVGFAGFREFFEPPELQLVYGLLPDWWGRGLATEAAAAVCDFGFRRLGFAEIRAATDVPNVASGRVLERLGLSKTRRTEDGPAGTVFWTVSCDTWTGGREGERP